MGHFDPVLLRALPDRTFGIMANYTLLAVPFFIFMGTVLEKSGLAEDLLETIGILFGRFRGGLAIGVIGVGALLAAATGVVGASVTAMGLISLPVMMRNGYKDELTVGVIAAAGTLGQIIPPSIVLIVLGDQMGVSVGALFRAGLVPGFVLTGAYVVYVIGVAIVRPGAAPAMPEESLDIPGAELFRRVMGSMLPPLVLILVVLGSIFAGVATPTEAGSLGALGAMALAAMHRRLSMEALKAAMDVTTRLTIMVIFLLIGSTAFTLVFRGLEGRPLDRRHAHRPPRRIARLPPGRQRRRLRAWLLHRLFRDRLHHRAVDRGARPDSGHRPDVAGDRPGGEHPDVLPHAPVRLLALLPQGGRAAEHSYDHDLPGGGPVHRDPADRARWLDRLGTGVKVGCLGA